MKNISDLRNAFSFFGVGTPDLKDLFDATSNRISTRETQQGHQVTRQNNRMSHSNNNASLHNANHQERHTSLSGQILVYHKLTSAKNAYELYEFCVDNMGDIDDAQVVSALYYFAMAIAKENGAENPIDPDFLRRLQ